MLPTLLPWIEAEYGARVTLQQNGLSAFTGEGVGSYWADLKAAGQWTTVGWQMFGSGLANGSLETAFGIGLAAGGSYFQVYVADILDAGQTPALESLAAQLAA